MKRTILSALLKTYISYLTLTNSTLTLRINLLGNLPSVRVGEVRVCWGNSQEEAVVFGDKLQEHIFDLVLNVGGLIPHRDLRHSREIH